jgi:hypothetical protein
MSQRLAENFFIFIYLDLLGFGWRSLEINGMHGQIDKAESENRESGKHRRASAASVPVLQNLLCACEHIREKDYANG